MTLIVGKISGEALRNYVGQRRINKVCFVIGETRDKKCYKVRFEGNNSIETYHKSYINIL